jgi:hypothetical protein
MEHRRRSSIINDDVENLMEKRAPDGAQIARNYRPTMIGGKLVNQIGQSNAKAANGSTPNGQGRTGKAKVSFGNDVEVYTRPLTTNKDKGSLHYNRQELFQVGTGPIDTNPTR